MKKYLSIIVLLSLFVIGCSEQTSINSPVNNVSTNEPNWIALPQAKGMQVNTSYTSSRNWDGKRAGIPVSINQSYSGGPFGTVRMSGSLSVEKNSYTGIRTISMTLETNSTVVTFGPAQFFLRPLSYNVTYTGMDLTGINPETCLLYTSPSPRD